MGGEGKDRVEGYGRRRIGQSRRLREEKDRIEHTRLREEKDRIKHTRLREEKDRIEQKVKGGEE